MDVTACRFSIFIWREFPTLHQWRREHGAWRKGHIVRGNWAWLSARRFRCNKSQNLFSVDWSMRSHICLSAIMNVVRVCRDFAMMDRIVPALEQLTGCVLPMKAIFCHLDPSFHYLEPLEYLQQAAATQCEPLT